MAAIDAVIMAAGRGSRLGQLTDDRPKSLLDLGGISPLELQLELLASRGVRRAVVVTGYRRELVRDRAEARVRGRMVIETVWNPFWSITNVIGSAWFALALVRHDFLYTHADTVFEPSILDEMLETRGAAVLPVDLRPCEPEEMKAWIVDGRVRHLSKTLDAARTAGEFIGIGLFRGAGVDAIRAGVEEVLGRGEFEAYFESAVNWAIDERGLEAVPVSTAGRAWREIDFIEDLEAARVLLPALLEGVEVAP